jgi:RNA polymerase sigma-70 factor (ECF subfamily)
LGEGKGTIIERALKGDSHAIGRLYDQYYSVVRRLTFSIDPRAPEDRVHVVLVKVLELLKDPEREFDQGLRQRFTGWLYRIAKNVILDERKRHLRKSQHISLDGGKYEELGEEQSPSQVAMQSELESLLKFQIDSLPPLYRDVLERYFFSHHSQQQIAEDLGIDVVAVRKRMQRAYDRLRANLKDVATTLYRAAQKKAP